MRHAALLLLCLGGLTGCAFAPSWTPSSSENTASLGDGCNAVAMREDIDAGYSGYDSDTRQKVFQTARADCNTWRNRLSQSSVSDKHAVGAVSGS